jgi:hypothetical protein
MVAVRFYVNVGNYISSNNSSELVMLNMMLLFLSVFSLLGSAVPVTISMSGFVTKAFKSTTSIKVAKVMPLLPSALTVLLSMPSLIPLSLYDEVSFADGSIDWIKVNFNNQLLYQQSLSCYIKMRRKKYLCEYNPSKSRESIWYKEYVLNTSGKLFAPNSRKALKFRRRFRLPYASFNELMVDIRAENWFPNNEVCDCTGKLGVPIDLLVLGSLRYLGRGWTFDDLEEATGISEETHRVFFHRFISCGRKILFPKWVKIPDTITEIEDCMSEYAAAGFSGCIGSTDATHIVIEKCYKHLKNQNLGGKSSQTTRG